MVLFLCQCDLRCQKYTAILLANFTVAACGWFSHYHRKPNLGAAFAFLAPGVSVDQLTVLTVKNPSISRDLLLPETEFVESVQPPAVGVPAVEFRCPSTAL